MEIINPSDNVLDLGSFTYRNCSFEFHMNNLCKKCSNLSGWILRIFMTRDSITMMPLFKSLVLCRLDYGSQLWSLHLVKHIHQLKIIQIDFIFFSKIHHEKISNYHDIQLRITQNTHCGILISIVVLGWY